MTVVPQQTLRRSCYRVILRRISILGRLGVIAIHRAMHAALPPQGWVGRHPDGGRESARHLVDRFVISGQPSTRPMRTLLTPSRSRPVLAWGHMQAGGAFLVRRCVASNCATRHERSAPFWLGGPVSAISATSGTTWRSAARSVGAFPITWGRGGSGNARFPHLDSACADWLANLDRSGAAPGTVALRRGRVGARRLVSCIRARRTGAPDLLVERQATLAESSEQPR